jgi:glyoxylase-like metal-dependent hydrolase (beta-lactamase superfamily II)
MPAINSPLLVDPYHAHPMLTCRVISIGTLACNRLWNESAAVRTAHATTTLVDTGDALILVDPSLPPQVIAARLHERSGRQASDITHVFCTGFSDDHIGGIEAFKNAKWLCSSTELEHAGEALGDDLSVAEQHPEDGGLEALQWLKSVHDRMTVCPDAVVFGVDLFPLPGVRPGTAGLLLAQPTRTVLITGDAVATGGHLEKGQVLPGCFDREQAMESFKEVIEIADVIVPGRDNIVLNPLRPI